MLDLSKTQLERNKRLIEMSRRVMDKGEGQLELENLSIDSDDLTQAGMIGDFEDIDGIELSDNDEIFQKNTEQEDSFSAVITSEHLKRILKYARQKRFVQNRKLQLKSLATGTQENTEAL